MIVAHQDLGPALLRALEGIVGPVEQAVALSLSNEQDPERARARLEQATERMDQGEGVLILTDMFGGSASNMSLPFLEEGRVEVLSGVNLPMLIKAHAVRLELPLRELAAFLKEYGCRNIVLASEIWNGKPGASV